jgi:RHS repeat-associated protein
LFVSDHLGSITSVSQMGGAVVVQYSFDPWGRRAILAGSGSTGVGYATYRIHGESAILFTEHRGFDPSLGRWLNEDPIGLAGGINLHRYVNGNPLKWVDVSGLFPSLSIGQPNGNLWKGFEPQDGLCTLGILIGSWLDTKPCVLTCCSAHAQCYTDHDCNWSSWLMVTMAECNRCNEAVKHCTLSALSQPAFQCRPRCGE